MSKIYFVRHQAAGVVHTRPFLAPPSDAQVEAVKRLCFQSFGATHPKDGQPYWVRIEEVDALGPSDMPFVPERALAVAGEAPVGEMTVSGAAHVSNP